MQEKEPLLMGQFAVGGATLHIPDRDDMQTAHDDTLQAMDMRLQQHSTFCTIEQCGDNDKTENGKLCLDQRIRLRLPKNLETLQILELTSRSEPQSFWMTLPRYWKLETGSTGDGWGKGGWERVVHKDWLGELPWSWSLNS